MSELINIFPLSIYKSKIILKEVEKRRMIEEILSMKEKKEATRNKGSAWTGDKTENSKRISISADISCFAKDSDALEHLTPPISKWSKF